MQPVPTSHPSKSEIVVFLRLATNPLYVVNPAALSCEQTSIQVRRREYNVVGPDKRGYRHVEISQFSYIQKRTSQTGPA